MYLAKDKHGRIGRKLARPGYQASVDVAQMGEHRGTVVVSARSIEADEKYYTQKENEALAINQARKLKMIAENKAQKIRDEKQARVLREREKLAKFDPMAEKLRRHYALSGAMGETEQVIESLVANPPADFSQSGANPQYVMSNTPKPVSVYRSDFRNELPVGNPLTRNGEYGPGVTDYERIVAGIDVNQEDIIDTTNVAGGTMLGRYNGSTAPRGYGANHLRVVHKDAMGDWMDSLTNWGSGVVDKFSTQAQQTAADAANKALQAELAKITGTKTTTTTPKAGTVVVQNPVQGAVNRVSETIGLPPWALYTAGGILGLGLVFLVVKAAK